MDAYILHIFCLQHKYYDYINIYYIYSFLLCVSLAYWTAIRHCLCDCRGEVAPNSWSLVLPGWQRRLQLAGCWGRR